MGGWDGVGYGWGGGIRVGGPWYGATIPSVSQGGDGGESIPHRIPVSYPVSNPSKPTIYPKGGGFHSMGWVGDGGGVRWGLDTGVGWGGNGMDGGGSLGREVEDEVLDGP